MWGPPVTSFIIISINNNSLQLLHTDCNKQETKEREVDAHEANLVDNTEEMMMDEKIKTD